MVDNVDGREDLPTSPQSLLSEFSTALKEKGVFERDLTSQEVEQMMAEIVSGLIAGSGKVDGNVQSLSVAIKEAKARLKASVRVSSPIKAGIDLSFGLENMKQIGTLMLSEEPIIDEHPDGMKAKIALKTFNLKGKLSSQLASPNELIFKGLGDYLRRGGVNLQSMALTLGHDTLFIRLQSTV